MDDISDEHEHDAVSCEMMRMMGTLDCGILDVQRKCMKSCDVCNKCLYPEYDVYSTETGACVDAPLEVTRLTFEGLSCEQVECDGSSFDATGDESIIAIIRGFCPLKCGGCDEFCTNKPEMMMGNSLVFGTPATCDDFRAHFEPLPTCQVLYQIGCAGDTGFCDGLRTDPSPSPTAVPEPCDVLDDNCGQTPTPEPSPAAQPAPPPLPPLPASASPPAVSAPPPPTNPSVPSTTPPLPPPLPSVPSTTPPLPSVPPSTASVPPPLSPPPSVAPLEPTTVDEDIGSGLYEENSPPPPMLPPGSTEVVQVTFVFTMSLVASSSRRNLRELRESDSVVYDAILQTLSEALDTDIDPDDVEMTATPTGSNDANGNPIYSYEVTVSVDDDSLDMDASDAAAAIAESVNSGDFATSLTVNIENTGTYEVSSAIVVTSDATITVNVIHAPDSPPPGPPSIALGKSASAQTSDGADEGAAIGGGVAGGVVFLILLGLAAYWVNKRKKEGLPVFGGGMSVKQIEYGKADAPTVAAQADAPALTPASGISSKV
jgi:hypothetical protein